MKKVIAIIIIMIFIGFVFNFIFIVNKIKNQDDFDYLIEDGNYSFIFIKYPTGNVMTDRYAIYPDKTLKFTNGLRKERNVVNPFCFNKIFVYEQKIILDEDYENLNYLINKIDIESIEIDYNLIQQGGNKYFIVFDGLSSEVNHYSVSDEEFNIILSIEQILEKYFGEGYPETLFNY